MDRPLSPLSGALGPPMLSCAHSALWCFKPISVPFVRLAALKRQDLPAEEKLPTATSHHSDFVPRSPSLSLSLSSCSSMCIYQCDWILCPIWFCDINVEWMLQPKQSSSWSQSRVNIWMLVQIFLYCNIRVKSDYFGITAALICISTHTYTDQWWVVPFSVCPFLFCLQKRLLWLNNEPAAVADMQPTNSRGQYTTTERAWSLLCLLYINAPFSTRDKNPCVIILPPSMKARMWNPREILISYDSRDLRVSKAAAEM